MPLFRLIIKNIAIDYMVVKQHGMLEKYTLFETGFYAEAAKALDLTSDRVSITIFKFFKTLVDKVNYFRDGIKFVSSQVAKLKGANV